MAQGSGTSFLKVFLGVLAAILVAGFCVAGGCLLFCSKVAVDMAKKEQERASYVGSMEAQVKVFDVGDNYSHVRGSVKNIGNKTVTYWKVQAHFLDSKKAVVDTAYTNSMGKLSPGDSKNFEIMQRSDPRVKSVSVVIDEVRIE